MMAEMGMEYARPTVSVCDRQRVKRPLDLTLCLLLSRVVPIRPSEVIVVAESAG